jgi:hypothetical protein
MDLRSYPDDVQTLANDARKLLREWLPKAREGEDSSPPMFSYTYGPGYRGVICTLILSKSGVKLGIAGGALLPDPNNLLRGAGKLHRHLPLKDVQDLRQPGVKELVAEASAACTARLQQG